jgi:NAD(P)-dependent dehydrogenase (short-subunit alcohol dehydrogenase family)
MTHKERVAVVSGAASGIGQELAVKLAERGASLVLLDLVGSKETAERISAVGGEVLDLHVDVASAEDWERAATEVRRRFGRTDILVTMPASIRLRNSTTSIIACGQRCTESILMGLSSVRKLSHP